MKNLLFIQIEVMKVRKVDRIYIKSLHLSREVISFKIEDHFKKCMIIVNDFEYKKDSSLKR